MLQRASQRPPAIISYMGDAVNVLFGGFEKDEVIVLDNAMRGHYIEALIWASLEKHNSERPTESRWINAGVGWGPWDIQRGRHDQNNRVRVQIKIKADKQLWEPRNPQPHKFSLGWNVKEPPRNFNHDFEEGVFGNIEKPPSYRCDLFLLGWHGLRPGEDVRRGNDQRNPNEYDFLFATAAGLEGRPTLRVKEAFEKYGRPNGAGPWTFSELPVALGVAADEFLRTRLP